VDSGKLGEGWLPMSSHAGCLTAAEADEDEWSTATRRVLLYLKALGVSPRHALALAQQALDRAEAEPGLRREQATLISLRSLLHARSDSGNVFSSFWTSDGEPARGNLWAVPPLNRGPMTPARIDRRPWLTSLARWTRRCLPFRRKGRGGPNEKRQRNTQTRCAKSRVAEDASHGD
jgi:hypothetical protein